MKTAIALFAAGLSVAALSTNASAQMFTAHTGVMPQKIDATATVSFGIGLSIGLVGFNPQPQPPGKSRSNALSMGTNYGEVMTGGVNNVSMYDHLQQFAANTSFGMSSGGAFKLASDNDIAIPAFMTSETLSSGLETVGFNPQPQPPGHPSAIAIPNLIQP